ncbi:MAG: class I SAM-dependent methyltransferase [Gemmatimonas sp.]
MLRRLRNQGTFRNEGLLGRLLARRMGYPHAGAERWLATATIGLEASILDVGCGDGMIARDLKEAGYRAVTGIDPFIPESFDFPNGARILRASVSDVPGVYDLIMMHHSLEHVPDQQSTMRAIRERLKPGGWCLIRIPTVSSFAFEHYGAEWVQLDAPRHLFLHSRTSIVELGERAGLTHVATHDDSTIMQFTGSERYRRGLSFSNEAGGFTQAEVQNYRRQTDQLNAAHQGDQIAVYFRNI